MPHWQKLPGSKKSGILFEAEFACHYNIYITIGRGRGAGLRNGGGFRGFPGRRSVQKWHFVTVFGGEESEYGLILGR